VSAAVTFARNIRSHRVVGILSLKHLVLGGACSGKSTLAERYARESGLIVTYVATAEALDGEMVTRIDKHKRRRPLDWKVVEEPLALAACLAREAGPDRCVLVDCLTLWLSNLMAVSQARLSEECAALVNDLPTYQGSVVLVSNEVGLGIVPDSPLGRRFRDAAGRLNQDLGRVCDRVTFAVSGLPMALKG
jgi:adenosylcobinamide kinase/adenosylcobinamide-phosphate guanylyltransferase